MVVSHKYRYLYFDVPKTGSTTIQRELVRNYSGEWILQRHAPLDRFLRTATADEKTYFVFTGIRNPMDDMVSRYFAYEMNWKLGFKKSGKPIDPYNIVAKYHERRFKYVNEEKADFPAFFKRYCKLPYNNLGTMYHSRFDFIIRFENINEDFSELLRILKIGQKRPLPKRNVTPGKENEYLSHYVPEIRDQAISVFGPFMSIWGYDFPSDWDDISIPKSA